MASSLEKTDAQCISADKSDAAASSGLYFSPHSFHCFHCSRFSPPSDFVSYCQRVPINKTWRWTESTPWSGWWCSHMASARPHTRCIKRCIIIIMAGIYSDCSADEILTTAVTVPWVSEQFLNGTSAHNRPFQCHTRYWERLCIGTQTEAPVHTLALSLLPLGESHSQWDRRTELCQTGDLHLPLDVASVVITKIIWLTLFVRNRIQSSLTVVCSFLCFAALKCSFY